MFKSYRRTVLLSVALVVSFGAFVFSTDNTNLFNVKGTGTNRDTTHFYIDSSGNGTFAGDVAVTGTLTTTGAQTQTGALTVTGTLTANGALAANGNNTLGNAGTDTLTIGSSSAAVNSAFGLNFSTTTGGTGTSILMLDGANQRVGINDTTPDAALDVGGTATVDGLFIHGAASRLYSRTEAELKAITPGAAGEQYYDSTNGAVVVSTGTGVGAFGIIYGGAACTGW
jgi:hypothetical protein